MGRSDNQTDSLRRDIVSLQLGRHREERERGKSFLFENDTCYQVLFFSKLNARESYQTTRQMEHSSQRSAAVSLGEGGEEGGGTSFPPTATGCRGMASDPSGLVWPVATCYL